MASTITDTELLQYFDQCFLLMLTAQPTSQSVRKDLFDFVCDILKPEHRLKTGASLSPDAERYICAAVNSTEVQVAYSNILQDVNSEGNMFDDDNGSISGQKTAKKVRTCFTKHQLHNLEKYFTWKKYLSHEERLELSVELRLSENQVKTWYQNRRTKWRREERERNASVTTPPPHKTIDLHRQPIDISRLLNRAE